MDRSLLEDEKLSRVELESGFVSHHKGNELQVSLNRVTALNGATTRQLLEFVLRNASPGEQVVLDFEQVASIDGKALALLLYMSKRLSDKKCLLAIANPSPTVRKILWITEIDQLIHVKGDGYGLYHAARGGAESTALSRSIENFLAEEKGN